MLLCCCRHGDMMSWCYMIYIPVCCLRQRPIIIIIIIIDGMIIMAVMTTYYVIGDYDDMDVLLF